MSGGRPAAETKALTTLVGGPEAVAERCEPLFRSFSAQVPYLGAAGSGQAAKLFNNALLMMNQASIADIVEFAASFGMLDPVTLVDALKLGSASSAALTLLNTMITPCTVDHLSAVEAEDMRIFDRAMTEGGVNADAATARGLAGANGLPSLIRRSARERGTCRSTRQEHRRVISDGEVTQLLIREQQRRDRGRWARWPTVSPPTPR